MLSTWERAMTSEQEDHLFLGLVDDGKRWTKVAED